ncbi:MAG TPA: AMP-binding protein [Patescibacteria group bacterium]|nr:AMP-binding protein [Patescibacteria group bacterium]
MTDTPAAIDTATAAADDNDNEVLVVKKSWLKRRMDSAVRGGFRAIAKTLYGAKIRGTENFNGLEGKPTLVIANHVSFIDGLLLGAAMPVEASFAIDTGMYNKIMKSPWVRFNPIAKFLINRIDFHPLDTTKPQAIRALTKLAKAGRPVMIFPEGRLTTTGTIMQVFGGSSTVALNADANIVPIYMDGLNFLPKGATRLKDYPRRLFPKLAVTVLPPTKLEIPEGISGKERRRIADEQLEKIMQEMPVKAVDANRTLIDALHDAARNYGRKREMLDDHNQEEAPLTYGKILTGVYALGAKLAKLTSKGENVGFLLPNSKKSPVAFFALHAYGRVPTMLNAKAEKADMLSYVTTASLKTIVTSREFVKLAKLEEKIEELSKQTKIVYTEDIKAKIGFFDKIAGLLRGKGLLPRPKDAPKGSDPAAIIFTSGSEGPPKGVVLSSTNFISNVAQVNAVTPIRPTDKIFNSMPIFHSFGLAGGMLMPLLTGVRSFQFPNPLAGKEIPKLAYFYDATIMFGTDTFLNLYARSATDRDFSGLRMVFAGAERLQDETYDTYVNRFNVRVNNAYGLSEAAPAVAMNVPGAHRRGTVGRFLPGIETRMDAVPDMEDSYRLFIKGPNVMLGYLKHDNPGVIQPPPGGWHDTGDIVNVSKEGYVKLTGRAKRFAKIGGEMVSLDMVENIAVAASLKKDAAHAVVLKQDPVNGDSIALFTTDAALKREQLTKAANETGRSVLGLPKNNEIYVIPEMPRLPTGKTDYVTLQKRLKGDFNAAATVATNDNQQIPDVKADAPKQVTGPAL